jgi:hypothetical protein
VRAAGEEDCPEETGGGREECCPEEEMSRFLLSYENGGAFERAGV